mgnify:CR=1 FL=1
MKKIAILVNEDTMQRCSCGGCLGAFMGKKDSFARYEGEEIELVGFSHSGGWFNEKAGNPSQKRCGCGAYFNVYEE